jgi:hypothetical protein
MIIKINYSLVLLVLYFVFLARVLSSLSSNLFGSFSSDKLKILLLTFAKERVLEDQALILLLNLVKVIHVKLNSLKKYLSDKGGEVRMSEIFGQNLSREEDHVVDNKSNIGFIP